MEFSNMTVELEALSVLAVLLLALAFIAAGGATATLGTKWATGNRDQDASVGGWVGRCTRAHRNLIENLLPFAAIVLVAHVAGVHNELTVLGAEIFLVARVAHAALYTAGIAAFSVRTIAHFAGIIGTLLIFSQLITQSLAALKGAT
jgi:uncharacterized MAPEG superfamily protein